MPETYKVTLSDGRAFNVTTEGGPPSEADVLASLGTDTPPPPPRTAPAAEPMRRSRTGALYTPAPASGEFGEFVHQVSEGISPGNVIAGVAKLVATALTDPEAAGKMVIEGVTQPIRTAASGNIPGALGQATSMAMVGGTLKALPGAMRGPVLQKALTVARATRHPVSTVIEAMVPRILRELEPPAPKSTATLLDEAVARGELRRAPGWTPDQGPLTRPTKPMIGQPDPMAPQPGPARPPIQVEPPVSAPAAPATGYRFNPTTALAEAKAAFQAAGQTPQPGELSWVTTYMKAGVSPDAAVAKALTYRPKPTMSAAEALAQRFGTPSDADVAAIRAAKNAKTTRQKGGTKP